MDKFTEYVDKTLSVIIVFFVSFVWLRYKIHNVFLTLMLTFFITLFCGILLQIFFDKKYKKERLSKITKQKISNLEKFLMLQNNNMIINFFLKMFPKNIIEKISKNSFTIKNESLTINFVPIFKSNELSVQDLIDIIKSNYKKNEMVILTNKISKESCNFLSTLKDYKINVLDIQQIYKIFEKSLPEIPEIIQQKKHRNLNELKQLFFNRKNAKKYFMLTLLFLISSFVLRYNLYYIFCSTITGVFSIICFNIKENNQLKIDNNELQNLLKNS